MSSFSSQNRRRPLTPQAVKTRTVHKHDPRDGVAATLHGTTTPHAMAPTKLVIVRPKPSLDPKFHPEPRLQRIIYGAHEIRARAMEREQQEGGTRSPLRLARGAVRSIFS
jgi:hypothetical protein